MKLGCDKGNKKGLRYFMKKNNWLSLASDNIQVFVLDINVTNSSSKGPDIAIDHNLRNLDDERKHGVLQ